VNQQVGGVKIFGLVSREFFGKLLGQVRVHASGPSYPTMY